ncbi:EAL domain-containing protein (putative c-di-GMP-specific phosphodiesterase class I) [Clostridium algifaecis]|uniref:EAL domain-containing protein (Putative c-di-GMP-specific phosphodiesterase class I) n=1 Tax=Clostridium algifaecis TaxID=1472040 RepID=A0ABS4KPP2_9CLOT|nr:EAL domain-containing protein (putative c-di-GMP-specific phosphodiesterase class I) [Clostridium algifaecis]
MYRKNKYNLKKIETDRIYKRVFSMDNVGVWEWNINKDQMFISGVNIALDDFGTGYSSLNYLITLPVNTLKIDKSFIDNIKSDKNKAVINSIVHLSKSLKYKIITEGVETKEQMDLLTGLGCNIIQGYYFSKPLPENEIENLLKSQGEILKIS